MVVVWWGWEFGGGGEKRRERTRVLECGYLSGGKGN